MDLPLISIIVPIYNTGPYLSRCIDSIINQSYNNIELILVNDGSTDNSQEICKYYARYDSRIVLCEQINSGVSVARNEGLKLSTGKYVMFVDSDDELLERAIEILYEDICYYSANIASALKFTTDISKKKNYLADNKVVIHEGTDTIEQALYLNSQSSCAKLFDLEFIKGIEFEAGRQVNEDGYFLFECYSRQPKMVHRNVYVYKYIARDGSASKSIFSDKYLDVLYFLDKKMKVIINEYPEFKEKLSILEVKTHLNFLQILCRTTERKYKKYELNSIKIVKEKNREVNKKELNSFERRQLMIVKLGLFPIYKKIIYLLYLR